MLNTTLGGTDSGGEETRSRSPGRKRAVVAVGTGGHPQEALEEALRLAGIKEILRALHCELPKSATLVVKPTLRPGTRREDPPLTYADPTLVEALVDWLQGLGWQDTQIAVPGPRGADTAKAVGYRMDVVELSADLTCFDYGPLIGEGQVAGVWKDAGARIVVGKARNDPQLIYTGALISMLSSVPNSECFAKRLARAHVLSSCAADILERLPVAFGVLDAWRTQDGVGYPSRSGRVAETGAVVASSDMLALDWMLGELMDLDGPELNPVVSEALQRGGAIDLDRQGDLTEWDPWRSPGAARAVLRDLGAGRGWGRMLGWREVPWTAR